MKAILQRVCIGATSLFLLGFFIATSKPCNELVSIGEILMFTFAFIGALSSLSFME